MFAVAITQEDIILRWSFMLFNNHQAAVAEERFLKQFTASAKHRSLSRLKRFYCFLVLRIQSVIVVVLQSRFSSIYAIIAVLVQIRRKKWNWFGHMHVERRWTHYQADKEETNLEIWRRKWRQQASNTIGRRWRQQTKIELDGKEEWFVA